MEGEINKILGGQSANADSLDQLRQRDAEVVRTKQDAFIDEARTKIREGASAEAEASAFG